MHCFFQIDGLTTLKTSNKFITETMSSGVFSITASIDLAYLILPNTRAIRMSQQDSQPITLTIKFSFQSR